MKDLLEIPKNESKYTVKYILKSLTVAAKTLAESGGPAGVKAERQKAGERVASGGGKYAAPAPPKLVVDNR